MALAVSSFLDSFEAPDKPLRGILVNQFCA
jgi:hypothetical protein